MEPPTLIRELHLQVYCDTLIPLVGHQHRSSRQCIPSLGKERRLQQTADLVPVGQRLCGCCGQPYCHPAHREHEVVSRLRGSN